MNSPTPLKKNLLIVSTALVGLLTVIYGASWVMLERSLKSAELQNTHQAVEHVQGLLEQTSIDFTGRFSDWSAWDDTYEFVKNKNPDYIASNLAPESLAKMEVDVVLYFNSQRQLVYGIAIDRKTKRQLPEIPQSILGQITSDSPLLRSPEQSEPQTGLLILSEGLMLITAQPILTTRQAGPIRGTIVFGRYLDVQKLQTLENWYHLSLTPKQDPAIDKSIASELLTNSIVTRTLNSQAIAAYASFRDIYDRPTLLLEIDVPRRIYQQGQTNLQYLLLALMLAGGTFGASALLLLNRQSRLYQQIQDLNTALESKVEYRTFQLSQALSFEALLKRITDKVRDSLDETQILQTAVEELARGLLVECCDTALYNLEQETTTIVAESVVNLPPAKGSIISMSAFPEIYSRLLKGKYVHCCNMNPPEIRPLDKQVTVLACPIFDDRGVIGDMWLYSHAGVTFSEAEIRLVQQVTNQCAIALRQARLYQAAQAQVAELEGLNRLKDDFLSTVSHELRTPMSSIKMAIQMLEISLGVETLSGSEDSRVARYFQILHDECEREIRIINDLLDISRLEAGGETLVVSTINPEEWLLRLVDPFIERTQRQQQHLSIDIAKDLPAFTTDLSKLERIISELLNNACKYTPAGERIELIVTPSQSSETSNGTDSLTFRMMNSGVNLNPEDLAHVFDKFYRIPRNDPWKHGGTGLGLALVKKLIIYLGGSIQVGTIADQICFQVVLPNLSTSDEAETPLQVYSKSL